MKKSNTIDQLRTLNELFVHTGASTPERAEHIRRVLDFCSKEQGSETARFSFVEGANRLARLHFGSDQERKWSFVHWDVTADEQFSPLWIRRSLIARMKQIAGSRTAFLLITGLREAICPTGNYWTKKRQENYDRMCDYINELVCAWSASGLRLQLVFF